MPELPHSLHRAVVIRAAPESVFQFFTDSARWASWWGAGSTIDAKPGGKVYIRHPNGIESLGEVLEVHAPDRIVFTYGFTSGNPIPPGASRVTIELEPNVAGTRLHLLHEFAEAAPRDEHVQGWRFQLSLFANAVANEVHRDAADTVDSWFAAWTVTDKASREELFAKLVTPGIRFHDRFSLLEGLDDLTAHVDATQRFMPGMRLARKGDVLHCQGTVLADWVAIASDGQERMTGTSVLALSPDGRIDSVTSFTK